MGKCITKHNRVVHSEAHIFGGGAQSDVYDKFGNMIAGAA